MRISDWSSDVCSSDLLTIINDILDVSKAEAGMIDLYEEEVDLREVIASGLRLTGARARDGMIDLQTDYDEPPSMVAADTRRSEEHTSELQSLMRISYAVFCLLKQTQQTIHSNRHYASTHPTDQTRANNEPREL